MLHRLLDPKYLVASYPLNGHAQDVSGHGLHGVWGGSEAYAAFLKNSRQAGDFTGADDYIQLPLAAANFMNGQTAWSVALWFLADAAPGRLFDFRDADNDGILLNYSGGNQVGLFNNTTDSLDPSAIALGTWAHVAAIKYAAGIQELYVDGVLVDSDDSSAQVIDITTPPRLGIESWSLDGDFNGRIADARIYNVALTNDEILKIIHSPVPTY